MGESELNEKTKLPLGLVVACIGAFLGGALWINNSLNKIDNRLAAMEARVSDRWTESDTDLGRESTPCLAQIMRSTHAYCAVRHEKGACGLHVRSLRLAQDKTLGFERLHGLLLFPHAQT